MRHQRVTVKRDNNTVHNMTVASWEIPILEFLFDEGNVVPQEVFVDLPPDREYPDPREEFIRLQKAYGSDVKTNIPHAVTVYGAARTGVRALAKAMETAQEEEAARPKVRRRRSYASDPLLA